MYNESILSCKIDLYRRFFVKSIDIIRNECYSTNRTKSVEEDTAMAVSSINMMRSELEEVQKGLIKTEVDSDG